MTGNEDLEPQVVRAMAYDIVSHLRDDGVPPRLASLSCLHAGIMTALVYDTPDELINEAVKQMLDDCKAVIKYASQKQGEG